MTVHVAGAGLSGLAAALTAAKTGHKVIVHEAAAQAGGRCRSFEDQTIGRVIDNGTHVLLGANKAAFDFLDQVGSPEGFVPASNGQLPFRDLRTGKSWGLDVAGHGTLALIKAARANKGLLKMSWRTAMAPLRRNASVARVYGGRDRVYQRLIAPLCTAIMNAAPEETAARAFLTVMGTLALGGQDAIRPFVARDNLAHALIDPALAAIERLGGEVRFHDPLLVIEPRDGTIIAAQFRSGTAALGPGDALVLALPPWALDMLPAASPAPAYVARAILCAHYAVPPGMGFPDNARMMGVIGGTTQWMTLAKSTLSVTVSAAETLMDRDAGEIAEMLWHEVSAALGRRGTPVPPWRVIKERRATADVAGQYGPRSQYHNLFIAGGWTDGRYPDTIEAAVASGRRAANCLAEPKQSN